MFGEGLAGGDVLSHGFDFDVEVVVGGGVEVSDGDDACEGVGVVGVVDDWDVPNFAVGHEVTDFVEGGVWGAVDDFFGHGFGDWGGRGIELGCDDPGEDVAFGDDACDFAEGVGDDEGADVVLVHELGGVEGCGGLWDGVDAFDPVVAVISFVPMFFVCEELSDGIHVRFLSVRIIGSAPEWGKNWLACWPVWSWPVIWLIPLCIFWGELEGESGRERFQPLVL